MNHTDDSIKQLFNELVDAELGSPRPVPALDDSRSSAGRWKMPLLAASVVAVLAAGSVLVIDAGRDQRSASAVAGPTSSQPRAADQDGTWLPPTGRYPDASKVTGVRLGPVPKTPSTAQGLITLANGPYLKFKDGKPHTVVLAYYPALGSTAVLVPSMEESGKPAARQLSRCTVATPTTSAAPMSWCYRA